MRTTLFQFAARHIPCLRPRLRGLGDDSGQVILLAAVGLAVITSFIGLAIDVGHIRYVKRNLQTAADGAALAAALEIQPCYGVPNCPAMQTAAQTAASENGATGSVLVTNCGPTGSTGTTLIVDNPPCMMATDPNTGKNNYVEVLVSQVVTTYFARLAGYNNVPVQARAEAARAGGASCIFALDTGNSAITVLPLAIVNASCGIVDESSSSSALLCPLLSSLSATQINVTGGAVGGLLGLPLCAISPTPRTNVAVPNPADPLAYLPKPSVPACGTSTSSPYHGSSTPLSIAGNATLYPDGAYCGGINILSTANVTFQPGTYVLKSSGGSGGLTIYLLSSVSGTGVTFYNLGPSGGINMIAPSVSLTGGVDLVAPTTGTYAGILFFQDAQDTASSNLVGSLSLNTVLEGTYYFPSAAVTFTLSGSSNYNIVVAKDIIFAPVTIGLTTLATGFNSSYSTLVNGSPVAGTGAVLVQ